MSFRYWGFLSPARVASSCAALLLACSWALAEGVVGIAVDPPEWNFGVRPREHLITRVIRLRPGAPEPRSARVEIERIRTSCDCLHTEILRGEGDRANPAEIRVVMDTDRFEGRFRRALFVALRLPRRCEVMYPVSGWVRPSAGQGEAKVFCSDRAAGGREFLAWWDAIDPAVRGPSHVAVSLTSDPDAAERLARVLRRRGIGIGPTGPRRPDNVVDPTRPPDVIAFFDGGVVLRGEEDVRVGLRGFLNIDRDGRPGSLRPRECCNDPDEAGQAAKSSGLAAEQGAGQLEIQVFYFSRCRGCRAALDAVAALEGRAPGRVRVSLFDTDGDAEALARAFATAGAFPGAPKVLPSMLAFVGDELLLGADEVAARVAGVALVQLGRGGGHLAVPEPGRASTISEQAEAISLAVVVLAGLADGVNPCAFAAMVLLVSVLATLRASDGGKRSAGSDLALGGGAFCAGVFAAYYAVGLALLEGVERLAALPLVEAVVFWAVWLVAVAGCVFSAVDGAVYLRTRDVKRVRLKVPERLRSLMAPLLRGLFRGSGGRLGRPGLVLGGFLGGVLIAVLEGVCTGQMYLPTIQHMASSSGLGLGLRLTGATYLLVYNLLFILPLLVILAVALAGVHFQRLSAFLERHLGAAKLLLAAVFLALAATMIVGRLA